MAKAARHFGHSNAHFSVLIDRIRNQFLKNDNDLNLHSMTKLSGCLRY